MNGEITGRGLKELMEMIGSLNSSEKTKLLNELIKEQLPGISVIFGGSNHFLQADMVVQINKSDDETIRIITEAIARRIER